MKYQIIRNKRHNKVNYCKLPVIILLSWPILTTYTKTYYFYDINSSWQYGEISRVVIVFDPIYNQNLLYKCIDNKIVPVKTLSSDIILFDSLNECMEYCLYCCMQKYSKYPEKYPSNIPYNINYKRINKLYNQFKAAYNNVKQGLILNNYIKISN